MKAKALSLLIATVTAACGSAGKTQNPNSSSLAPTQSPSVQNLSVVERPQSIVAMMEGRGQQDDAAPKLRIVAPAPGSVLSSSTVKVKVAVSGDLKGYKPGKDPSTQMGNHIHVILDNQPYEAYYNLGQDFELRNVSDGEHTLRVFPSRPWHESYKNDGGFQMVRFSIKGGNGDVKQPVTTNGGIVMSNTRGSSTAEGKDVQPSNAGAVDSEKPLLTYSRPKGDYSGADAEAIMVDFWLSPGRLLSGDAAGSEFVKPCPCRVRYTIDGGQQGFIDTWQPIWLSGWTNGKHSIKLDLIDQGGNIVENGGYNSTTREITVTR